MVGSRPDKLPREAMAVREQSGTSSMLAVPALVAGRVVCALVLQNSSADAAMAAAADRTSAARCSDPGRRRCSAAATRPRFAPAWRRFERLNARLEADNVCLKEEIKSYHDFDEIVGESGPLRLALARLAQVAPTNSNVLLLGPTGTGKELFARAVHERSRRHARALVRVNCAALPPTLVESELFGHEKGAFTGAVGMRQGRFELADGGTIFLDEIGDLPPEIQVKFLRVLQEGEFERVGSSRSKRVDVRVIAATHHDLEAAVAEGRFRADLYYRLSVYPIHLPSLRERVDDIPRLVWFFIHRHQRDLGRQITKVPQSRDGCIATLRVARQRSRARERGGTRDDRHQPETPCNSTLHWRSAPRSRGQTETSDNLDAVQRMHIESVLERCGWRINGAGNTAERLGHPSQYATIPHEEAGCDVPGWKRPAPEHGGELLVGLIGRDLL